jgi:N-acetylglucosaminyldiphosphoundecaprenol N-acetyl-beta-D-mannosaminyltransferase
MENINNEKINIFGLNIDCLDYGLLLNHINASITQKHKINIAYANTHILNNAYKNNEINEILNSFSIVHPDGIGVYLASKFLYGKKGLSQRMAGSDFYSILIKEAVKKNWSFYFWGHDIKTLERIKEINKNLPISGYAEGYNFDTEKVTKEINNSNTNILIVGLGFPFQENLIYKLKDKLNCNVIIAVGEGIKVFSDTKTRGPVSLRKLGLEWLVRLLGSPLKYAGRYLLGNPLFLLRIIKLKLGKLQ